MSVISHIDPNISMKNQRMKNRPDFEMKLEKSDIAPHRIALFQYLHKILFGKKYEQIQL